MGRLVSAFRLFISFVLGVLIGAIGLVVLISQETGVGNLVIAATPRVKDLQAGVERVEAQRDEVTRRLEKLAGVLEQVERRYEELGRRFEAMEAAVRGRSQAPGPGSRQPPVVPSPPAAEPPGP